MSNETLKNRIKLVFGEHPLTTKEFLDVEKNLCISLPEIFKELNQVCSYEYSSIIDFFHFSDGNDHSSVTSVNKRLYNLYPSLRKYLILSNDSGGLVLMDLSKDEAPVFYCAEEEIQNFSNGNALEYKYDHFSTFAEFFKFLLDEEEAEREEEEKED